MIKLEPAVCGSDFVHLKWKIPKYLPDRYRLRYSCKLSMQVNHYIQATIENIMCNSIGLKISGLNPQSTCVLTVFAIYNPASIDSGITVILKTLKKGKFTLLSKNCLVRDTCIYTCTCVQINVYQGGWCNLLMLEQNYGLCYS